MKIDIICNDGSPIGVTEKSIFGLDGGFGVGGAELALLTISRAWHDIGYDITLYNNPNIKNGSEFLHKNLNEFIPSDDRDILIIFRSPNPLAINAKGKKVWWSCDQYTVGDFKEFSSKVDDIVVISNFHKKYFENTYGITGTSVIDLPVRIPEYDISTKKIDKKCIFNSIPDRGLFYLISAWEEIIHHVPDAHLVVTSDWRLWDRNISESCTLPYKLKFSTLPNVEYLGAIKREELVKHELESVLHLYPSVYEELFCIAVAETSVAGAFPITSSTGALPETNMGSVIDGFPSSQKWMNLFISKAVELLSNPDSLSALSNNLQNSALNRFSVSTILKEWDKVFHG